MVGDVNGDGLDDVVIARQSGVDKNDWLAGHTNATTGQIGSQSFPSPDSSYTGLGTYSGNLGRFLEDVTGDGIDDVIVINGPTNWNWSVLPSGAGGIGTGAPKHSVVQFGLVGDQAIMGDFDGDGYTDQGVYRQAGGNILWSSSAGGVLGGAGGLGPIGQIGGAATDSLLIGELNGDAFDDAVMVRQDGAGLMQWFGLINDGTGHLDYFNPGTTIVNFGLDNGGDIPFLQDINGDGMDDIGISRGAAHYVTYTTAGGALGTNGAGDTNWAFGLATDVQMFGDFTVPEPATMLLLAFGGLLMRRRR